MHTNETGRTIQSSTTTLRVIDALVELEGARTTEIADHLDVSKSTVSNHLHTLRKQDYVTSEGDIYQPTLKFAAVGEHSRRREAAFETAINVMKELDRETPFHNSFMIEENGLVRYLTSEVEDPGRYDRFAFIGEEEYLHATASGKAILSALPRERVEQILESRGLPAVTDNTITERQTLYEELELTAERGYAINDCENLEGIYVLAKPVLKPDGTVLGSMNIGSQKSRIRVDRFNSRANSLLSEYTTRLEENLDLST